jgi:hypothetical protein
MLDLLSFRSHDHEENILLNGVASIYKSLTTIVDHEVSKEGPNTLSNWDGNNL